MHQDVQEKLRREITEARQKHGRDLTYDELVALPYLDAICRETLRLYVSSLTLFMETINQRVKVRSSDSGLKAVSYHCSFAVYLIRETFEHNDSTRKDVVLSLSNPIRGLDGREMSGIAVPQNTTIIIGITACNRNPEIWGPDSFEWKPERWLKPLPDTVARAHLPGVYSNL